MRNGEVRPYIDSHWTYQGWSGRIGVNRVLNPLGELWKSLRDPSEASKVVHLIKHHLLYCHQLALEDPIRGPVRHISLADPDFPASRLQVAAGLQVLSFLEPLIDAGIVIILPKLPRLWSDLHVQMSLEIKEYIWEGGRDWLGPLEPGLIDTLRGEEDENPLRRRIRYHRAARMKHFSLSLAENLRVLEHVHQRADMYLPTRAHQRLFSWYIERGITEAKAINGWPMAHMEYLPTLLSLSLPNFSDDVLSANDLIAIRKDGLFEPWYAALRQGLQKAEQRAEHLTANMNNALEDIRVGVSDAVRDTKKEVKQSSLLSAARSGTVELTVSSAVGLSAALLAADPITGTVVGGTTILLQTLAKWLIGRSRLGQEAFLRHAALFDQRRRRLDL